jgi:hypothetical protein
MKKIAIYFTVLLSWALAQVATAQRVMNDPSYSIHNYKHPNKSNYMKKQEDARPVIYVEEVKSETPAAEENSLSSSANYKGMSATKSKTKTFKVSNSPSAKPYHLAPANSNGNYKQQFPARQRKTNESKEEETQKVPVANN